MEISIDGVDPNGEGARGGKGDDQRVLVWQLRVGDLVFEDEISKRRVRRIKYPSLSVSPILEFRCHRVPLLSVDMETRCNRDYGIGGTEVQNQINPRHSVEPRFSGWS